ncbi:MAG: 2-oxoacid:acceptor oxidoreductase subunit alpha [Armatimonadota bacterium]|nr:2-oxoacid:acceptor oxidoreductase subunit alpha [Armatimonadota bacterium]MDR5703137.1 2-oxoacid:acceptor oxidoreductase subunit alpha [Armatimonadota bacterium]
MAESTVNNMTIRLAGEAGQGVDTGGAGFAKALANAGLWVFTTSEFMSRIRGGLNFYQIRVADHPLYSHVEPVNLLLAFTEEAVSEYAGTVVPGGGVIYDQGLKVREEMVARNGVQAFPMPLVKIAQEVGGNRIMMNTAALGAAAGVVELPFEFIAEIIQRNFRRKGDAVAEANLKVAEAGYRYAREHYAAGFPWKLQPRKTSRPRLMMTGNQAIGLGALAAGCRFISAYPMTPASSIMEWIAAHATRYKVVVKQTEDEIAAITMAIGAAFMGARAMTATSGGGFSLMVEALGLAGMAEIPVVVVESQRPGPSTGMPTKTEQGDLLFVLHASQGEFPRIVLAPGTIEQCFWTMVRAFNLAEKYQCPVIVLTDNYMAFQARTVLRQDFDYTKVEIDRGALLTKEELEQMEGPYLRYKITESGISPRALPGHPKAVFQACSDEHDEYGHFEDEDAENRVKMQSKRMRKLRTALAEIRPPEVYGPEDPEVTFLTWGTTYGPVREAVDILNSQGVRARMLHFVDIWPFPVDAVLPLLERSGRLVAVENNGTGQFAHLLRAMTGREVDDRILRFDGRPLSPDYILRKFEEARIHA